MPFAQLPGIVFDPCVRGLCRKAYPNHPKGCPNFGKKAGCPPTVPRFDRVFSDVEVWAVWNEFDFAAHVKKMRAKHPDWSQRQVECCLYWQGTARKQLKSEIRRFLEAHSSRGLSIVSCPEGMGVNVTATMDLVGVGLEWPPVKRTYQVVLAARPLQANR